MRPLTDRTPKPLLAVHGRPLIEWHLISLAHAGVTDVVINTGWLGEQFEPLLGNGERFNLRIQYSHEGRDFTAALRERGQVALETAGGIARALPLLVDDAQDCFWVVAGDVFMPNNPIFESNTHLVTGSIGPSATDNIASSEPNLLAHIALVANPIHRPLGDFALAAQGRVFNSKADAPLADQATLESLTYSTLGLYRAKMFESIPAGNPNGISLPLVGLLRDAASQGALSGHRYRGPWTDVGTPQVLTELNAQPTH